MTLDHKKQRILKWGAAALVAGVAFISGAQVTQHLGRPARPQLLAQGRFYPDRLVHDSVGAPITIRSVFKPQRTVVILFSIACARCFGEAAVWQSLAQKHTDADFVAVVDEPDIQKLQNFRKAAQLKIPVFRCDNDARKALGGVAIPTIYVIDPTGRIVYATDGDQATANLEEWLDAPRGS